MLSRILFSPLLICCIVQQEGYSVLLEEVLP